MSRRASRLSWGMRLLLLLLCPAALACAQWLCGLGPHPRGEVDARTAAGVQGVLWIDARSREQFKVGHIPGALLLNQQEWEALLPPVVEAWSPEQPIIVYCGRRKCEDGHSVAERLARELGASGIRVLQGGFDAWRGLGLPVTSAGGGGDAH